MEIAKCIERTVVAVPVNASEMVRGNSSVAKTPRTPLPFPVSGKLANVNRKACIGRNLATCEAIKVPAKRVVKFCVTKAAKDAVLGVARTGTKEAPVLLPGLLIRVIDYESVIRLEFGFSCDLRRGVAPRQP